MLILPPGHAEQVNAPRRTGARERWMVRIGAVLTVALVVVAVIAITAKGHSSGHGCVDIVIPYSTGGQELYKCGGAARALCAEVGVRGGFRGDTAQTLAQQCRIARVRVGPA
jgi:hypothetical protein